MICGEGGPVGTIDDWKNSVLKDILYKFHASNVFNIDEIILFFRLFPEKLCHLRVKTALLEEQGNNA